MENKTQAQGQRARCQLLVLKVICLDIMSQLIILEFVREKDRCEHEYLHETKTFSFVFSSEARKRSHLNPNIEKTTTAANKEVKQFVTEMPTASRRVFS